MRVHDRRKALGLSQTILAQRVRVSRQWIAALERGKSSVELGKVLKTLRALGLVIDVRVRHEDPRIASALDATREPRDTPLMREPNTRSPARA